MNQASFYSYEKGKVRCGLCSHRCLVANGHRGLCGVREHRDGQLYTLNYGKLVAANCDPIEKKPLFHVLPTTTSYSISTVGCNFRCQHCQNHTISQIPKSYSFLSEIVTPGTVVDAAVKAGCKSISYTYVEPTVFYEFAYDCCVLAHDRGLKNVFVSNGYMAKEPSKKIAHYLDAINIDIKGFSETFYRNVAGAKLAPVLENVALMHSLGVWVEVTTLLIPGLNDSQDELRELAAFIASIDTQIPWHLTAFYPTYKMTSVPSTTVAALQRAKGIGKEAGLIYVYLGNVTSGGEKTTCSACNELLIERKGFSARLIGGHNGACPSCGAQCPGVWG